ncbi:ParB N-terminal domain-containing protein [Salipiger abyssi]|uniref:Chromosome partitioning protein, ParB family n=1 Tax=Salipiger abyssi TaxID=1250539 RepID=A0A1P8UXM5_9RHOB|nr:ParB N-terminal domain-containing protein [Salipiger abyssi]ALF02135.1 ParB-like nuclease domain protein [Pelagibaca phage vB_PeaS-P1]APZ54150.1 chromosome partitioning protein, ParB family [Salipiger abyssi]
MAEPRLMQKTRVRIADVDASKRLRPVTEAGVESLIASINEIGVMKDAIHVRQRKDGVLALIAGGHRLEAGRRLGWDDIEAKVWTDVTDDWARLMEIDDNLAGAEMNALDTAVFLAERKRVYEKLHPETRAEAFKGNQHTGKLASDIVSFATATAEKFGMSKRQVERIIAAGVALEGEEVGLLRRAPRPVTLKDLTEISKIGEMAERRRVVLTLFDGKAKSATEARRHIAHEEGKAPAPVNPTDKAYQALAEAWRRAPAAARRRFLEEFGQDVSELMPKPEVAAE